MRIILIIFEILSKLAAPVAAYFWARGQAKTEKLEDENEGLQNRADVEDELSKLPADDRRKLLRDKWGRRDEANPPAGRRYESDF